MVRRTRLKFGLLAALVVVGHLLAVEWIGRQADKISALPQMTKPMFTRMLRPTAPPAMVAVAPAVARPAPRRRAQAMAPKPPASAPKPSKAAKPQPLPEKPPEVAAAPEAAPPELPASAPVVPPPPDATATLAAPPAPAASEAVAAAPAASAATPAASAASAASASAALDTWPVDTRLTYQLGGHFRSGPLFGNARVQWQREGAKYQVRLDVAIQVFGTQVLTSQGEVTPQGLVPRAYEELRPGRRRAAQFGDEVLLLEGGKTAPRPPGVQDTASQFVELSQRFATGREKLEVGRAVKVWLARPGGVDEWTYDIVDRETLRTPLGEVEAFHLKPRLPPNARGNITAEMWFAPSLQYLPVRIKVLMGNEAEVDLRVDHIEQR